MQTNDFEKNTSTVSQEMSNSDVGTQEDVQKIMQKYDRESNVRLYTGIPKEIVRYFMVAFSAFVIYMNLFSTINERIRRSLFLSLVVLAVFVIYPAVKGTGAKKKNYIPFYDIILGIVGAFSFAYYSINFKAIVSKGAIISTTEIIIGAVGILILFEACRRVVGIPLICVSGAFIAYAFIAGKKLDFIVYNLFYTLEGIMGTPIGVCSTYIVLFIIFGAFLEKTGISEFFIKLANSIAGASSGGPAKVAVISSALCGMVSGSSVANTVTTGSVTIPLMKKTGYKGEFAAAVEASASTGGQIMPPIMGAAAFLMAEMTGEKYSVIVTKAILPAFLYFLGIFIVVHFEAKKLGLHGLSRSELPKFGQLIIKSGYLLLPLVILVWMVMSGSTMTKAAVYAMIVAIMVSMPTAVGATAFFIAENLGVHYNGDLRLAMIPLAVYCIGVIAAQWFSKTKRSVFEIVAPYIAAVVYAAMVLLGNRGIGFFATLQMRDVVFITSIFVIAAGIMQRGSKMSVPQILDGFEAGAKSTISVAVACGIAGIIAGVVTMTGLGGILINAIVSIAGDIKIIGLFLTMLTCILLGMGVPTTANYVIMATTCAPILIKMGINPIAANMFVFYFGIIADITPPVALAAYAGSAIAKSNPFKTGVNAVKLAIAAFIVPYIFALNPAMLFIDTTWSDVLLIIVTSVIGLAAIAAAVEGFFIRKMNVIERLIAVAGGLMMVYPGLMTDIAGVVIIAIVVALQFILHKKNA